MIEGTKGGRPAMDIEQQQAEVIEQFVKQAGNLEGASLATLLIEATSHPSLFAFSEILSVPNLSMVIPLNCVDLLFFCSRLLTFDLDHLCFCGFLSHGVYLTSYIRWSPSFFAFDEF